jgi:putative peptidoglycan lipid II flippase
LWKIKAIMLISLASKLVGFAREAYISYLYGISKVTDIYFTMQQVPVMVSNYMFGAFNLAFMPQYVQLHYSGDPSPFLRRLLTGVLGAGALLTLLMLDGRIGIIPRLLGVQPDALPLAIKFTQILALSIIPIAVAGVSYGMLHARQEHVRGMLLLALAPCVMVLSMMSLSLLPNLERVNILPWSFVAGSLCAFVWGALVLWKVLGAQKKAAEGTGGAFSMLGFLKQLCASSLENIGFNVNQVLNVIFAGSVGAGAVAINAYAFRIAMLPLSGIVTPANQMIQASLAKSQAEGRKIRFSGLMLKLSAAWILLAAAIFLLREPLVRLVYQRGAFSPADTLSVAQALIPYSCYFVIMATNQVFARYFFAVSRGGEYSKVLMAGYLAGNCLKPFLRTAHGLTGIIWACVIGEGLAALYFTAKMFAHESQPHG